MNETLNVDIVDLCQSAPECAAGISGTSIVHRDNMLDTIDLILKSDTQLVTLEGEEGMGKTTLLLQFARRHNLTSLCLFIKPTNRWGYDPEILRYDLCNQLNHILKGEELDPNDCNEVFFRNSIIKLGKRAKVYKETYYFVIDGLEEIPEENISMRESILDMIPFNMCNFRFLMSGDLCKLSENKLKGIQSKPYIMTGFTFDETERLFSGLEVTKEDLREIYLNCRKIPGRLAAAKRILASGMDVKKFLLEKYDQWYDLFEIEWRKINDSVIQNRILAILALDRKDHTIAEISNLLSIERSGVESNLVDLGFICKEASDEDKIGFVTEAFRKFAAEKLNGYSKFVNQLFVEYLLKDPESETALSLLPSYLERAEKYETLLSYLSPERFLEMLKKSQSLIVVQQKIDLGIATSKKLSREEDLMRFCIQKAVMNELGDAQIWRSEIEARTALNDYEAAIALAQTTLIKEDRLHLLAIVCKKKREKGSNMESEILEQIKSLYNEVRDSITKDKAIEIASDLIFSCPEIAIDMVEKSNGNSSEENELDVAFAKLTVATLVKSENRDYPQSLDEITSKIKDPSVRDLYNSVHLLIGDYTADEVINEVEKLQTATNKIFLIKHWTTINKCNEFAFKVVEYGLNLTIVTTAYAPNASVLRSLAMPLPYIKDSKKALQLIRSFDSQKGAIESLGPTEDYVMLQLILAHAESKHDFDATINRLIDVYFYISELRDLSTKTVCLAHLVSNLVIIDPNGLLEDKEKLHTLSTSELKESITKLLETTAYHYQVCKGIISALSKTKPEMAYDLAVSLNTEDRRDSALLGFITEAIDIKMNKINIGFIVSTMNKIITPELRCRAFIKLLERLNAESDDIDLVISNTLILLNRIKEINDAEEHCKACCLIYSILSKDNESRYEGLLKNMLEDLLKTWDAIDVGWSKVNIGYKIVADLSKVSVDIGKSIFEKNEKYKEDILVDSNSTARTFISALRLAIRAYSGLLPMQLNTKFDLDRLINIIDQVPSYGERAELWGDLAARCYRNKQLDQGNRIVTEHVKPLLQYISKVDLQYWNDLTISLAPVLYYSHKTTSLETILTLHPIDRDYAYMYIAKFIFTKQIHYDPYDDSKDSGYDVTFEELKDVVELVNYIDNDSLLYGLITDISNTIHYKRARYTGQQQNEIAAKLTEIINRKLPSQKNIKHDGYKIVSSAQVARIQRANLDVWQKLISDAHLIPNMADRAYVLCSIAIILPGRESVRQTELLKETKAIIDGLPSIFDRIEHYELFASLAWMANNSLSRECLQTAMKKATESDNPDYYNVQRKLIDLAHRLDPDLASTLASLADEDEARLKVRQNLKQQMKVNKLKKSMSDNNCNDLNDKNLAGIDYSKASWKLLASLNSGRIGTIHINDTRKYMEVVARLDFTEAYPILAWIIENSIQRYSRTNQAQMFIRQMYESILLGAELSLRMAERSSAIVKQTKYNIINETQGNGMVVHPGERELAIEFLRNWFENDVGEYIKISDPFFGPDDLEILSIIKSVRPDCSVQILTSIKHHNNERIVQPWEETYRNYWRCKISDQEPPETDIVIVGTKSQGEPPIHDRWWVTNGSGLRIGTSFNSLGLVKVSEISKLSIEDALLREKEVDQYINRNKREINGEKLLFNTFTL